MSRSRISVLKAQAKSIQEEIERHEREAEQARREEVAAAVAVLKRHGVSYDPHAPCGTCGGSKLRSNEGGSDRPCDAC